MSHFKKKTYIYLIGLKAPAPLKIKVIIDINYAPRYKEKKNLTENRFPVSYKNIEYSQYYSPENKYSPEGKVAVMI